jgi:hypothetical protein
MQMKRKHLSPSHSRVMALVVGDHARVVSAGGVMAEPSLAM